MCRRMGESLTERGLLWGETVDTNGHSRGEKQARNEKE